jgi:hypothetical protein
MVWRHALPLGRDTAAVVSPVSSGRVLLHQRETTGFVFCLFFFFENWLYTATYMADARAMVLPLVTTGDPEFAEHDFHAIFSSLGVLAYDTKIAMGVRVLGWFGMLGVVGWFVFTVLNNQQRKSEVSG